MADFAKALPKLIRAEGGYKTHTVKGDRGGKTYAGISQRAHPKWLGWKLKDADPVKKGLVHELYGQRYWDKVWGDKIRSQDVAESLFMQAVHSSPRTAIRAIQRATGAKPKGPGVTYVADGYMGGITLKALNEPYFQGEFDELMDELILLRMFAAKIKRYDEIAEKDTTQRKFFRGWVRRARKGLP